MNRPVIHLPTSRFDIIIETITLLFLFLIMGIVVYALYNLPAIIPIHFNGRGIPDNYGKKETLLFIPILALLIYLFLSYLNKHPHWFNYPVTITAENAPSQYAAAVRMVRILKCCVMLIFLVIVICSYLAGTGAITRIPAILIPVIVLLSIAPVIYYLIGAFKKSRA